jgi:hypothetical protein
MHLKHARLPIPPRPLVFIRCTRTSFHLIPPAGASANSAISAFRKTQVLFLRPAVLWLRSFLLPGVLLGRRRSRFTRVFQNTARAGRPVVLENYQRQRRYHEQRSSDGCRLRQNCGGTSRAEDRLRSHPAKCARQIGRLTALQQNDNNQKKANNDVQGCY